MGPVEQKLVAAVHTPHGHAKMSTASFGRADAVGGHILAEGDCVRVRWPSGVVMTETCHVAWVPSDGAMLPALPTIDESIARDSVAYVIVALGGGVVARVDLRQPGILCEIDDGAPHAVSTAGAGGPRKKPFDAANLRLLAKYLATEEETAAMLLDAADEIDAARRRSAP